MEVLSWKRTQDLVNELASIIIHSGCEPNLIVAVARGGFVPARLLSTEIKVKKLTSIGITYVDSSRSQREVYSFPEPIGDKDRIILVEDALESGRSLVESRDLLIDKGAQVWTAALFYRTDSVITPDFSLGSVGAIPRFPWE